MKRRDVDLPDIPIYGLIGGIPKIFGGRTSVCLQRANTFAELGRRNVEILTLSPAHGSHPERLEARLRRERRIGKHVKIRNVWADLRRANDEELRRLAEGSEPHWRIDWEGLLPYSGKSEAQRKSETNTTLQTDRFREDGTRLTSYRIDNPFGDKGNGKAFSLFSHTEELLGYWHDHASFYLAWLDWVMGTDPAILINDGPGLAKYLSVYKRDNITVIQAIHSRHSSDPSIPTGKISSTYLPTLKNMERFDRVAVLTHAQRNDILQQHYGVDNIVVLPNMFVGRPIKRVKARERGVGVMLARLTHQKRIDHAISAIDTARNQGTRATLDIYGVPDDAETSLKELIESLNLGGHVRLRGFDTRAKERFQQASFTLLTSKYEGQGVALLEAMAAGCVPIAYDIKYGPSDVISDGINGFLVPPGDADALGDRITKFVNMDEVDVKRMRRAAIARTRGFRPAEITRLWATELAGAVAEKVPPANIASDAKMLSASVDQDHLKVRIKAINLDSEDPDWAMLTWSERKGKGFGRVPAQVRSSNETLTIEAALPVSHFEPFLNNKIDFWLDVRTNGNFNRLRVKGVSEEWELEYNSMEFYGTKFGSLSARVSTAE